MPLLPLHDLTSREHAILEQAETLAAQFQQHAPAADQIGEVSPKSITALKTSGYPGLTIPTALGGHGAHLHEFALAQQALGRADASLALIAAMNGHVLGSAGEAGNWPDHLYERVARAAATHGALSNALASEPELGSPSRGGLPRTRATRSDGHWIINGRKTWSTGAPALNFLIITAAVEDAVWRFVVPADTPGVRIERTWGDGLALRGSSSHDVIFDDVHVPDDHAIPPSQERSPSSSAWFWTAVAATYLGVGEGALHALSVHARERVPTALGKPIATLPKVQEAIGQMTVELIAAEALLQGVTRAWSQNPEARPQLLPLIAGAKAKCTNAAVHVTDVALRTAGGMALSPNLPLERFFRDARAGLMHPPSDDTALTMLGRAQLGEPS